MKLKMAVLILIPVLVIAQVNLNDGATIWTQDQGFFQIYREINVRALNVDGDVVIWGKEVELPSRALGFDPINHSIVAQFNEFDMPLEYAIIDDSLFATEELYLKSNFGSPWVLNGTGVSRKVVNSFHFHDALNIHYLVAATEAGVYQSANGGGSWKDVKYDQLNSNILDAVLSPVNQTSPGFFLNKYFAAAYDGVYQKSKGTSPFDNWEILPRIEEDQDFEDADPGNLDFLPEGWTQSGEEDEYNFVRLDTLNAYNGDYSLLIHSSAVGGDVVSARYGLPDLDYLVCGFQFLPLHHSGMIEIKNHGLGIKVAYRYGEMSYYTPEDGWVAIDGSGVAGFMFNELKFVLEYENGIGIINTFDSLSGNLSTLDTIELYEAGDAISEAVFSTESFGSSNEPYWIDDFYAEPSVYSLAPHPDSIDYVYAGTPLGIYSFDGNEWVKSLDVEDEWFKLETDLTGNYMVAASHDLVYTSNNQGDSWDNITDTIPSINDIYVDVNGVVYAATDSFPYKYDGSSWTQMNNGFLDYGVMNQVKVCGAITVIEPDTIIVGNHNGMYFSVDGGSNWFEDNEGIEPYPIDSATIAEVDAYFEDAVPSDTTKGVLELLTDGIGPIPDVDGDSLLDVVLLDVYEDGEDESSCFFDPTNEDTLATNSNGMEIIYVDVDDVVGWLSGPDDVKEDIARELTSMIEWNYDLDEDPWIVRGYEGFGIYLTTLGADSVEYGVNFSSANLLSARTLQYIWIQYLRDLFGDEILDELNTAEGQFFNPQSGLYKTRLLQGREAIDSILVGRTPGNFVDAFEDWGISCYMNNLVHIKDISFTVDAIPDGSIAEAAQLYYSAKPIRIYDFTNPLIFSGNDNNDFNLFIVGYAGDSANAPIEVEASEFSNIARNIHEIDLRTAGIDSFDLLVEVISNRGTSPSFAYYNLSLDQTVDTTDMIGLLQSPLADRFVRMYYYTGTERLCDAGEEGAYVIFGADTLEMSLLDASSAEGYRVYYGDIVLPAGDISEAIHLKSEDISGNKYEKDIDLTVKAIGKYGGYIASSDNSFRVDIPANALNKSYHVTACNTGNSYYVGPGVNLNVDAHLTIDVSNMKSKKLSIYRKEGDSWVEIPSVRKGDAIEAEINTLGEYKAMEGDLVTDIPVTFELTTSTLNPFDIRYAIPEKGNVRIDVYNALGQRVKTLVDGIVNPGVYTLRWDTRTDNDIMVGNGIYFYRLSASGKSLTKKIVLVR